MAQACPANHPATSVTGKLSAEACPEYFRWIHEDLRPWKRTGISRFAVESAKGDADFRLVIVNGKAYVEQYKKSFQTRDLFTMWGILQLLKLYPNRLPDLDLMFQCDDRPVIQKRDYRGFRSPPALFRYSKDDLTYDIVFPDWTFWGWAETNVKPWRSILEEIKEGNKRIEWRDRVPYAYWRGSPYVAPTRVDLLKCNVSEREDWNVRLYSQNWEKGSNGGFKNSNLADQCTHRYKIYVEGWGWSVSEKYILACDSMTLLIKPYHHDFFTRSMVPLLHYWPIRPRNKCRDLKFAVEWGNTHPEKAQEIGKAGSNFIHEELKMDFVYDYMFHLLNEYSKLLKFKPAVPPGAVELCLETVDCSADVVLQKFVMESMVTSPSDSAPCSMPPPYSPEALRAFLNKKENLTRQVEMWGDAYWENQKKQL
ncbi:hypothetical protein PVL29_020414 [Vitis rotundifolia]|nr:hypothetical protein PVL29_020414 [Vitis rotundifolia]